MIFQLLVYTMETIAFYYYKPVQSVTKLRDILRTKKIVPGLLWQDTTPSQATFFYLLIFVRCTLPELRANAEQFKAHKLMNNQSDKKLTHRLKKKVKIMKSPLRQKKRKKKEQAGFVRPTGEAILKLCTPVFRTQT